MPIRQRFDTVEDDNVTEPVFDPRGAFDPSKDPYPGSQADQAGYETPWEGARYLGRMANAEGVQHPHEMRVQDLLAQCRMSRNPGEAREESYRKSIRSPLTAIRAFLVNGAESRKDVNTEVSMSNPLWAFRYGKNGMRR